HYLKVLCDEVFGRASFVANAIWQKKYTVANDARWLSDNHDHVLIYCKDPAVWKPNRLPRSDEMNARYKNPDNHPKGPWKATPLHAKSGSAKAERFVYTFRNGVTWSPPPGTFPRFSRDSLARMDEGNEIWFGKDGNSTPARKTFLSELDSDGSPALTIWTHEEVGHNHQAKDEVRAFNEKDVFSTPKPERLLARVLTLATRPGDLVLDSFAGSGTTGAVAHKMRRRWILIEQGSHIETHILPRLKAVVDGADPGGVTPLTGWTGGGGFRFFNLAPSLLTKDKWGNWVINRAYNPEMLAAALCKLQGYRYEPSPTVFWQHGQSTERDYIYVTTQT
ncbi:MAG TPA: site-specific DNA-methyltransferase, partial [Myxococcota bacterium]|nr:site-specific DNA-methyltransferase [Myxococcota bacterium]